MKNMKQPWGVEEDMHNCLHSAIQGILLGGSDQSGEGGWKGGRVEGRG